MRKENEPDEAWEFVKRNAPLSAQAKAAWHNLWHAARRRPDTITVAYAQLAADEGASSTAARRWIATLATAHYVEVLERPPNAVRLYIKEPREVCRAPGTEGITGRPIIAQLENSLRSADVGTDSASHIEQASGLAQRAVDDAPRQDGSGTVSERNRSESVAPTFGEETRKRAPLPSVLSEPLKPEGTDPRSAAAAGTEVARPLDGPAPIGAAIGVLVQRFVDGPTPAEKQRQVDDLVAYIQRRVNDPKLRVSPCLRMARPIVDGELRPVVLDEVLAWVDQRHRAERSLERWKLFAGAAKKAARRNHIEWPDAPAKTSASTAGTR